MIGHDRDHAWHFRKTIVPTFIPASASWSKVRQNFRLISIMLDWTGPYVRNKSNGTRRK